MWFVQSYGKLEPIQLNSIHSCGAWDSMRNAQIDPFAHLPHLLPTYALSKSVAKQSVIWCCWQLALQRAKLIFNEMNKNQSFTCAIVFPLPLRRQLKRLSMPSEQRSKLKVFSTLFLWWKEREFTASSELFHGFSSMFPWLLALWDAFVLQMIQIGCNSLSLCSKTTQFRLNSSQTS